MSGDHTSPGSSLASTARLLRCCLETGSSLLLLVSDRSGRLQDCNEACPRELRRSREEIVGKEVWGLLTAGDADRLRTWTEGREPLPEEPFLLNFVAPDGAPSSWHCWLGIEKERFVLLAEPTVHERRAFDRELVRMNNELAVLSRENARKSRALTRALEDLKTAQAMLVHREKMASLGQMTAGIAHEINNPLAFVLSNQSTLRRDLEALLDFVGRASESLQATTSPADAEQLRAEAETLQIESLSESVPRRLEANIEGLRRIAELVYDLRTFSRLDEAESKECDLAENLAATLRFLAPLSREREVEVVMDVAPLPPLLCSPAALNQAISNVVANAIDASSPGQVVRLTARQEEGETLIVVEDSGTGIKAQDLARVCEPFFTTKAVGEGTGLGLSIAHQIVTAHHGTLDLESTAGHGTRVTLRLPG